MISPYVSDSLHNYCDTSTHHSLVRIPSGTNMLVSSAFHLDSMQQGLQLEDAATLTRPGLQKQHRKDRGEKTVT